MQVFPEFQIFKKAYEGNKVQLIWKTLPSDLQTPVSAMLHLMHDSKYHFLLESVEDGANKGRYSIIGLDPDLIFKFEDGAVKINNTAEHHHDNFSVTKQNVFDALRELLADSEIKLPEGLPPMSAGLFGYAGFDMVRFIEDIGSDKQRDDINIPDMFFIRPQVLLIFDSVKDLVFIVVVVRSQKEKSAEVAFEAAKHKISLIIERLSKYQPMNYDGFENKTGTRFNWSNFRKQYSDNIAKAKEYIKAGDIFQVVLSERYTTNFTHSPFSLYRSLRCLNPSPYLFFIEFNDFALVGSSPEILVKVENSKIALRPLAGTCKRGRGQAEDETLIKNLLSDKKEIAEHLMLLDLGRNDVGRVAEVGSVKVTEQMAVEKYAHVMHIVSNVEGVLRKDKDSIDALMAAFPAGTVSGAPKIRAMQIINELEKKRRSFYGGCVGYFTPGGNMDTCITLRTALVKGGKLHIQAGAGIVADSVAENECEEIYNKAKSLMVAAAEAEKYI